MNSKNREPKRLRQGKEFHKKIQKEWLDSATGEVILEKSITKPNGRKGRVDIFIGSDEKLVAIAEIKASDWDSMSAVAVRRNVRRQVRQIWNYIKSQLELGKEISPGILFPKRPKDINRMKLIEQLFDEEGIPVVWEDKTIAEVKAPS